MKEVHNTATYKNKFQSFTLTFATFMFLSDFTAGDVYRSSIITAPQMQALCAAGAWFPQARGTHQYCLPSLF